MKFEFCYVCTTCFFLRCRKNIGGLPLERNIHFRNSSVGYLIKMVLAQMVLAQTCSSKVVFVEKGPKWHFCISF